MPTTDHIQQQRRPPLPAQAVPKICLQLFDRYFFPLWRTWGEMETDPRIPATARKAVFEAVATAIAIQVAPSGPSVAALVYRLKCLIDSIDRGDLESIGDRYFGDREYLVRHCDGNQEIKAIAAMAAACADLLSASGGFTIDALAAAVLSLPAGCPLAECPPGVDDCVADTK